MTSQTGKHWTSMAGVWNQIGSPLRPAGGDLRIYREVAGDWMRENGRAPRVLLLGVTPEIYEMPWPDGTDFLAVDRNQEMIDMVWPGPPDRVRCSTWQEMELPGESRDLVWCDGGLHLLDYPEGQQRLAKKLSHILAPHGRCIFRLFTPPEKRETVADVLRDMSCGIIRDLNLLKLRLAMAILSTPGDGVELASVWRALHEHEPDLPCLAEKLGWPVEHLLAINAYKDSSSRYYFVSLEQAVGLFAAQGLVCRAVKTAEYELSEQCPVIILEHGG